MRWLAILAIWLLTAGCAWAQCNPPAATAGMVGCLPQAGELLATDSFLIWRPSTFPASALQFAPSSPNPMTFGGPQTLSFAGTALTLPTGSNASIGGTLGVTGATTFGAGSENILTITPGAATTNATTFVTPSGSTGGITINTRNGGLIVTGASSAFASIQGNSFLMPSGITSTLSGSTIPTPPLLIRQNWAGTSTVAGNTSLAMAEITNAGDNVAASGAIDNLLVSGNYGGTSSPACVMA